MKAQLVTTGWRYGQLYDGGPGHLTACLVMSCIANRVRRGWCSWLEALDNIPKYAAELKTPLGTPTPWEPSFVKLLHEVEGIYDGSSDPAKGGLYWCDLRHIETEFFKEAILAHPELHPRIVDMNSFTIFG